MRTITLYAKAGCHLCDEARDALEMALETRRLASADPTTPDDLALLEVDIRRDPTLFERYRYRIPVIAVDDAVRLEGRIAAADIQELVAALR